MLISRDKLDNKMKLLSNIYSSDVEQEQGKKKEGKKCRVLEEDKDEFRISPRRFFSLSAPHHAKIHNKAN